MRKKKVVHISTVHQLHDTRILYRECASLVKFNFDVSLLICEDKSEIINGVKIIPVKKSNTRFKRMTVSAFDAVKKATQLKASIYHFHDPELIPWMLLLVVLGKKVVFDVHENIPVSIMDRDWIPGYLK